MADLDFYKDEYSIHSQDDAFNKLVSTLQTYYDAAYYVNWNKVISNVNKYECEYALLSTLCGKTDRLEAARNLLRGYPQLVRALPQLIGTRGEVSILVDPADATVKRFSFDEEVFDDTQIDNYADFIDTSGLLDLMDKVASIKDYATGVEVGLDSNARKNRSGDCGVRAISPHVDKAVFELGIQSKREADYNYLNNLGLELPSSFIGIKWDWAFWTEGESKRLTVMEVNHYGGSGSKPSEIVRGYSGRQRQADQAQIGFIWVTDGLGWNHMLNPLRDAFDNISYLITVRLAKDGLLKHALQAQLFDT